MADDEVNVALTAIIVAAVALLIATAQLLQQIFGTADGYRRCQPSVIGPFASRTSRKWRWREFRFEKRNTTPMISLNHIVKLASRLDRSFRPIQEEFRTPILSGSETYDRVNWLQFLQDLNLPQSKWSDLIADCDNAVVKLQERSWDFMPPDIIKPLASSTIGAMIVFAHGLGMRWTEFRPYDGVLRVESRGKSLTSTTVRGIGIVFQYTNYLGDTSPETNNSILAVPERHADMMKFGIITTPYFDRSLVMVNPKDSVKDVCTRSLRNLGLMDNLLHTNADESLDDLRIKYFLNDVLGFLMDYIPNEPSEKIRILGCRLMLHFPYPWKLESPTSLIVGHTCLAKCLHAHIETMDSSSQAKASLEELYQVIERIRSLSPFDWKNKMAQYRRSAKYHLLDYDKNFKMTQPSESFPQHKEEISPNGDRTSKSYKRYKDLISCHFSSLYYNGNREKGRLTEEEKDPNRYDIGGPYNQECLEWSLVYVKNVPEVVKRMRWMGYEDADQVIVAWWKMIVRGMLWFLPHQMGDPSPPDVDASWWDSNLPVQLS